MASNPKGDDGLELLWTAHMDELKDISDADILEGVDMPKFRTDRIQMMASVRSEAGRRRLAAAKNKLESRTETPAQFNSTVSIAEARAFLREAANNPRYTMAARGLDDWPDELVIRTYARLKEQEARDFDTRKK